jgi:Dna[CI] antecedent DciA-like protein
MEQAGAGLAQIMGELLRNAPPSDAPIFAWPVVCGAAVASRTRPLLFTRGVLRVEVPDSGWRTQLMELERRYVRAFELLLGNRSVQRIEFILARADHRTG